MNINPFIGRTRGELLSIIADNMTKLMQNNILAESLKRGTVKASDIIDNEHLLDRVGAILNAEVALGRSWGAERFYAEIARERTAHGLNQEIVFTE